MLMGMITDEYKKDVIKALDDASEKLNDILKSKGYFTEEDIDEVLGFRPKTFWNDVEEKN